MKLFSCSLILAHLFLCLPTVSAAVIERDWKEPSDGLLTYDTVSQREWLDLTETQLFKFPGDTLEEKYQAVVDETSPGGVFDQFTVTTADDVLALAQSAGIDTFSNDFKTNQEASSVLISLLGDPIAGAKSSNKLAGGFPVDGTLAESLAIAYLPNTRDERVAGVISHGFLASVLAVQSVTDFTISDFQKFSEYCTNQSPI